MGATAVGVRRPYAYGMVLGGVDPVVHVLRSLLAGVVSYTWRSTVIPRARILTPNVLQRVR